MCDDFDFRRKFGTSRRRREAKVLPFRRGWRERFKAPLLVVTGVLIGGAVGLGSTKMGNVFSHASFSEQDPSLGIGCVNPSITDGDTLRCGSTRIRLAAIDAPELPGHCRKGRECTPGDPYASTENLRRLINGGPVQCRQVDTDHYGRAVAMCSAKGQDLSCAQYKGGYAVQRYGFLSC